MTSEKENKTSTHNAVESAIALVKKDRNTTWTRLKEESHTSRYCGTKRQGQ